MSDPLVGKTPYRGVVPESLMTLYSTSVHILPPTIGFRDFYLRGFDGWDIDAYENLRRNPLAVKELSYGKNDPDTHIPIIRIMLSGMVEKCPYDDGISLSVRVRYLHLEPGKGIDEHYDGIFGNGLGPLNQDAQTILEKIKSLPNNK